MNRINSFQQFLEGNNPNTPQGYLSSLSQKTKPNQQQQTKPKPSNQQNKQQRPTDEVDDILLNTEEQKNKIIARKDAIEKGLLNNINQLEPQNQKDVQTQVNDYKKQVVEFDKTVKQIGNLNQTLKKSNIPNTNNQSNIQNARTKNF